MVIGLEARQDRGVRDGCDRSLGKGAREDTGARCEAIDVRAVAARMAVGTQVVGTGRVEGDEQNIGPGRLCGRAVRTAGDPDEERQRRQHRRWYGSPRLISTM